MTILSVSSLEIGDGVDAVSMDRDSNRIQWAETRGHAYPTSDQLFLMAPLLWPDRVCCRSIDLSLKIGLAPCIESVVVGLTSTRWAPDLELPKIRVSFVHTPRTRILQSGVLMEAENDAEDR